MTRTIKFRKPDGSTFTIDEPDVKQLVGYDCDDRGSLRRRLAC